MTTVFLSHPPGALGPYFGDRAIAALQAIAEVRFNPDEADLDALIAEQRTTNELLREQLHRRGNARDVLEALRSAPVDLDGRDVVDLDYSPTRGTERP